MLSTVADTQCYYPRKAGFTEVLPSLSWSRGGGCPHPGLSCPKQENGLCPVSLSQTTLISALFKVPVPASALDPKKGSCLASTQRPLLHDAPLPAPPAPACSAAGRETPTAGDSCPWALAKPHKRAGQGSALPGSVAEWAGRWQRAVGTA